VSIYGPPKPPPGRRLAQLPYTRADTRATLKVALWFAGFLVLVGVSLAAYASLTARDALTAELKSAETARRDAVRALEAAGLESAERLPPIERPGPRPLHAITAEDLLRPPATEPARADPLAPLQSAELLTAPAPASPAKLQSAELIP
jgi:hypothetical protein